MTDKYGTKLKVGDIVHVDWDYDLIVSIDDNGEYYGKLVCDENHSCKDIPYSLCEEEITKL